MHLAQLWNAGLPASKAAYAQLQMFRAMLLAHGAPAKNPCAADDAASEGDLQSHKVGGHVQAGTKRGNGSRSVMSFMLMGTSNGVTN